MRAKLEIFAYFGDRKHKNPHLATGIPWGLQLSARWGRHRVVAISTAHCEAVGIGTWRGCVLTTGALKPGSGQEVKTNCCVAARCNATLWQVKLRQPLGIRTKRVAPGGLDRRCAGRDELLELRFHHSGRTPMPGHVAITIG